MPPDLALDHRDGERAEGDSSLYIETVCRLHQSHRSHLHQVLELLAATDEPGGNSPHQRKMGLDQSLPPLSRPRLLG